jgi:ParB family chromosome partitioning protein
VLQPIRAVRTADGQLRVEFGHRRTLAAIEAGLATVPVIVVADEQTDTTGQVERIVRQYAENEHRTGLTQSDKLGVVEQLSLLKVSAAQIAKRTKMKRPHVDQALAVTRSQLAKAASDRYELTLDQAAAVAEFDTDPDTVKALIAATKTVGLRPGRG